jgi:type IV secretion system protein VirB2
MENFKEYSQPIRTKKMLKTIKMSARRVYTTLVLFLFAPAVFASASSTTPMPWEGPLQAIMNSISGPVAKICGVIAIVIAGLGIAFGESGSGVRRLFQVVMGLAIAFTAASIVATLFQPTGGVPSR